MHGKCGVCVKGVVFRILVWRTGFSEPHTLAPEVFEQDSPNLVYEIIETHPESGRHFEIAALPANVEKAFREAEASMDAGNVSAAAVMYRKAIERTVKAIHPEGEGMLNKRIRTLEKEQRLPPAMIDLMDMVKFIGNDGAHEDEDPTREDVELGQQFTRLLLTYIWALPAQIEAAKAKRDGQE